MATSLDLAKGGVAASTKSNLAGWCQYYAGTCWEVAKGRPTPNSYPNATAAYRASTIVSMDPNGCPPGGFHYFEYGGANGDGHVGLGLGSGRMASGTSWTNYAEQNLGKSVYVHKVSDYATHLKYLGWSYTNGDREQITGYTDPWAAPINKNQRQVKADSTGVRRRTEPNTSASYDGNANLQASQVVTPRGWVNGEAVSGNKVWFVIDNLYSHSGSFTDAGTHDLADLNTYPNQRTVRPDNGVNVRTAPKSGASLVTSLDRNTTVPVTQYTKGDNVTGSNGITTDIWYLASGGFAWSGGFTSQATSDLEFVEYQPDPDSEWPDEPYSFEPDLPHITTRVVPSDWSNFENEWSQPDPANRKGFPDQPTSVVRHQWGEPGAYSLQSVLNTFQARHEDSGSRVSPHFTIGINSAGVVEIIQNVKLDTRAYHAGAGGNDYVGVEIDPLMTEEIIKAVRLLEAGLQLKYGYRLHGVYHKDLEGASTSCGTYIEPYDDELNAPFTPEIPEELPEWFKAWLSVPHEIKFVTHDEW